MIYVNVELAYQRQHESIRYSASVREGSAPELKGGGAGQHAGKCIDPRSIEIAFIENLALPGNSYADMRLAITVTGRLYRKDGTVSPRTSNSRQWVIRRGEAYANLPRWIREILADVVDRATASDWVSEVWAEQRGDVPV